MQEPDDLRYLKHVLAEMKLRPNALAKLAGFSGSTLTRPLNDPDYKFRLSMPTLQKIERATGISYAGFVAGAAPGPADATPPKPNVSFPPRYQAFPTERGVPLMGQTAMGANGRFILNGMKIGEVFMPPDLEGVEGAYAVQAFGTSMEPAFRPGQTVWLNPYKAVRAGDYVVAQILEGDDAPASYLKEFVSQSGAGLKLKQYNPGEGEGETLTFPEDKVFAVHKVVFAAFV